MSNDEVLLEVENLKTFFCTNDGVARAANGKSSEVYPGVFLGEMGESCCTRSMTSLSIMYLISKPGRADPAQILLDGEIVGESLLIHNIIHEKKTS